MAKLSEKAMLVNLSISTWTARKLDKKVTRETNKRYGASQESGRYNKILVAEDAIKKMTKFVNKVRTWHYYNTLPWCDNGPRILSSANYFDYTAKMREFKGEFSSLISEFVGTYPDLKEQAKITLNGLYNELDYPPVNQIARKFSFDVDVSPLPEATDFRVSLSDNEVEKIQSQIEDRVSRAKNLAMRDLWDRLYDVVKHMQEKLTDTESIFRDSLVENI